MRQLINASLFRTSHIYNPVFPVPTPIDADQKRLPLSATHSHLRAVIPTTVLKAAHLPVQDPLIRRLHLFSDRWPSILLLHQPPPVLTHRPPFPVTQIHRFPQGLGQRLHANVDPLAARPTRVRSLVHSSLVH